MAAATRQSEAPNVLPEMFTERARDNNLYNVLTKLWLILQRNSNKYPEIIQ